MMNVSTSFLLPLGVAAFGLVLMAGCVREPRIESTPTNAPETIKIKLNENLCAKMPSIPYLEPGEKVDIFLDRSNPNVQDPRVLKWGITITEPTGNNYSCDDAAKDKDARIRCSLPEDFNQDRLCYTIHIKRTPSNNMTSVCDLDPTIYVTQGNMGARDYVACRSSLTEHDEWPFGPGIDQDSK